MENNQDIKNLLEEILQIQKQSLEILKSFDRDRKWRIFFKVLKWIVVIALIITAFIIIRPFVIQLIEVINTLSVGIENASSGIKSINNFLPN